ncbi:MAG: hypothetical protein ACYDDA_05650 [Acidiferrobacteraceae bacterium]
MTSVQGGIADDEQAKRPGESFRVDRPEEVERRNDADERGGHKRKQLLSADPARVLDPKA